MDKGEYIIAISHSNYLIKPTGTEKAMREIADVLIEKDIHMLQIFSFFNKLTRRVKRKQYIGVNFDEKFMGIYCLDDLPNILYKLNLEQGMRPIGVHIHHLLNYILEDLGVMLNKLNLPSTIFIHDYYTICKSVNLIDSTGEFCGFNFPSYEKCEYCKKYCVSKEHISSLKKFLNKIWNHTASIVIPSQYVYANWIALYPEYIDKALVRSHMLYQGEYEHKRQCNDSQKIRVAFIGGQLINKGYTQWKHFVKELGTLTEDYSFYYLGTGDEKLENVTNVRISTVENGSNAMVDALRYYEIDYVVLWSICAETYSYVYFEASMAGTCIITNPNSGNIATMITEKGNGVIFNSIDNVIASFVEINKIKQHLINFKLGNKFKPLYSSKNPSLKGLVFEHENSFKVAFGNKNPAKKHFATYIYIKKNPKVQT
ncbi:hypothetical protein G9F73_016225 [Clostridium estertheticum]|uniref:glycosyltransferase family 4 protein n=1 Tax=Clostridium estertheticum TaxID=238834 RepID=UPI0013EEA7DC|nr:glycosyltransferase family 4 protein [Clostridium estertheticum]MBZ9609339.1 hypothetical protein [Clostridium estertheticum]